MKTLFDGMNLNGLSVKNRIVRSATYEGMADDRGAVTARLLEVYRNLAGGGAGIIITSGMYVSKEGEGLVRMTGIHNDGMIPGLSMLASVIKEHGSAAIAQIGYCGVQSLSGVTENTFNPSDVPDPSTGHSGRTMTLDDIKMLEDDFVSAAHRAKKAGFDGVQIHIAHGYLLSQFLSPYMNKRTDKYGGSVENRIRISVEIAARIKKEIPGFTVAVKINATDAYEGGTVLDDAVKACVLLEKAGVDAVEVSGGIAAAGKNNMAGIRSGILRPEDEGYFAEEASKIASAVSIPVISVGGYRSPSVMEKILNETKIEFFSMARPFFAEPDLPLRWESGNLKKAKCLSCGKCRTPDGNFCTVFGRGAQL